MILKLNKILINNDLSAHFTTNPLFKCILRQQRKKTINIKLLLICLAFEQVCQAKPTANIETKEQTKPNGVCDYKTALAILLPAKGSQVPASLQLLQFTGSGLVQSLITYIENVKHTSDQILSDQELQQIANRDEVKTFMQKLQRVQEEYQHCHSIENVNSIVELFFKACSDYYKLEELDELNSDGEVILKVVKKFDIVKIIDDFENDINKLAEKVIDKYENLKESINEEKNNKIAEKISNWYEEFKTINHSGQQVIAFNNLTKLYAQEFLQNKTNNATV